MIESLSSIIAYFGKNTWVGDAVERSKLINVKAAASYVVAQLSSIMIKTCPLVGLLFIR